MRQIIALCVVCGILWANIGVTQDQKKAAPLQQGQVAPFDGILIPPERVEELIGAEIERDKLKIKLDSFQRIRKIEVEAYENALKKKGKWYNDPQVNRWAGVIFGMILTGAAVYGAGQLD